MNVVQRLGYAYGRWNRRRKAAYAIRLGDRLGVRRVLLVGVSGARNPVNNLVEDQLARHFREVVASGIDEVAEGWPEYVYADGRDLPFGDRSFDLIYANAVIEHVGSETDQRRFVTEVARVGRAWIITTPNRYFPVEAHYHTIFTHWREGWAPRGTVSRLLGVRDLRTLLPFGKVTGLPVMSPTLTATGIAGAPSARE